MTSSVLVRPPDRIERSDVTVMEQSTADDLPHIQELWVSFEELVGLHGRKMYACVDTEAGTYTTCTPLRDDDDATALGLTVGTLRGGRYLRGRLVGEPPGVYALIAPGMDELTAL